MKCLKLDCDGNFTLIQDTVYLCDKCKGIYKKEQVEELLQKLATTPSPTSKPSLAKKAMNFTKAAAKHVANGLKNVPTKVYNSRMELCNNCEKLSGGQCSECGCIVKLKAAWGSEKCPIGKWSEYKETRGKCGGCGRK